MKYAILIICAAICNAESTSKIQHYIPKSCLRVSPENVENAAILPFDSEVSAYFRGYSFESLSDVDFVIADSITMRAISEYNASQIKEYQNDTGARKHNRILPVDTIEFSKYKIQIIGMKNKNGERFLYVNCFSRHYDDNWRRRFFQMLDGGNSYFHLLINLDKRKCIHFIVNGEA